MAESYAQAIAKAKVRYKEAMDESAWDALAIAQEYDRPLVTVCKEIAGDGWSALAAASRRRGKTAGQTADQLRRAREKAAQESARRHAKVVLKDPEQAAKVIASLPPQALDEVYHEARLARAGEDRTPANRQAAKAAAHQAVAPMRRAIATTHAALCAEALVEATDDLREAMEEDALTSTQLTKIERVHSQFVDVLAEATMRVEGARA